MVECEFEPVAKTFETSQHIMARTDSRNTLF